MREQLLIQLGASVNRAPAARRQVMRERHLASGASMKAADGGVFPLRGTTTAADS